MSDWGKFYTITFFSEPEAEGLLQELGDFQYDDFSWIEEGKWAYMLLR